MMPTPTSAPLPNPYVVPGTRLVAGEYPGLKPQVGPEALAARLAAFRAAGVTAFVDLTEEGELSPYCHAACTPAGDGADAVTHDRLGIRDLDVCTPALMHEILDTIDRRLAEGRTVYVHCWGGAGRTGLVVGCWLVRHGRSPDEALTEVDRLFRTLPKVNGSAVHRTLGSPQTEKQRAMVRAWR